jgi:hypothetical protein
MRPLPSDLIRPARARDLELVPFSRIHDGRYMIYWCAVAPSEYSKVVTELEAEEKGRLSLESRTLRRVTRGSSNPRSSTTCKAKERPLASRMAAPGVTPAAGLAMNCAFRRRWPM